MRAIILAGGKGTRLRPYTTLIPKPLVPLGGRYSILEIVIMQLAQAGFSDVTLAVNHLSHLIMAYFGDGSRFGVRIGYSVEESELGTIGPLTLIDDLPDTFLVMNGDILCDLDYAAFLSRHETSGAAVSVAAYRREQKTDFGVLKYGEDFRLTAFEEKPVQSLDVSMGVYCLNRSVIDNLPKAQPYGFDRLMLDGLSNGVPIRIEPFSGYWLDIGRPDDYERANEQFPEIATMLGLPS